MLLIWIWEKLEAPMGAFRGPLGVTFQHIIDMLLKRLEKNLLQYTSESVTRNFRILDDCIYLLKPITYGFLI